MWWLVKEKEATRKKEMKKVMKITTKRKKTITMTVKAKVMTTMTTIAGTVRATVTWDRGILGRC
jgi:hypothetical protein